MLELAVRGGLLVTPEGIIAADVAVEEGVVVGVGGEVGAARTDVNAAGLHVFPGLIDAHVHFNEPGRTHWEGFASGSAALAAGGGTLFCEMPLNADPPLLTPDDFKAKRAAAERSALTDFALWGGLTPDNLDALEALAACGVVGFKAFMADSGIPEFRAADDLTLLEGMRRAAALGLPVAVHAESEALTKGLGAAIRAAGGRGIPDYLASRPVVAELEAIQRVLLFAAETGAELHVVHVSTARGVGMVREAAARGVRATCETCPHYLYFSEDDVLEKGAVLKCAPPLRAEDERLALLEALPDLGFIASDHSPAPPELKTSDDFFRIWGGISGVQATLGVLLSLGAAPERVAALTAAGPAARFRLAHKGRLEPGYDADFSLVDLRGTTTLDAGTLLTRHKEGAYLGKTLQGRVRATYLRGRRIVADGKVVAAPAGRLVTPERTPL
jgi:allantoinase